jgi:hypothetical protein
MTGEDAGEDATSHRKGPDMKLRKLAKDAKDLAEHGRPA